MKKIILASITALSLSACAGLGVATIGAIKYYQSQEQGVASVNINAPQQAVYDVALLTVNANSLVNITGQNDAKFTVDLEKDQQTGNITVNKVDKDISNLTVTSSLVADEETSLKTVLAICKKLDVKCETVE